MAQNFLYTYYYCCIHMWQSWVEIKHYSVAYFDRHYRVRSTATQYFHYGWDSYLLCKFMNTWHVYTVSMSPTLTSNVVMQLKCATEYCSISTQDCHTWSYINWTSNYWREFDMCNDTVLRNHTCTYLVHMEGCTCQALGILWEGPLHPAGRRKPVLHHGWQSPSDKQTVRIC